MVYRIYLLILSAVLVTACNSSTSPDTNIPRSGRLIYQSTQSDGIDMMMFDAESGTSRLIADNTIFWSSPGGGRIAALKVQEDTINEAEIFIVDIESGETVQILPVRYGLRVDAGTMSISPDGKKIFYTGEKGYDDRRAVIQNVDDPSQFILLPIGAAHSTFSRFSPDGSRIAFFTRTENFCCTGNLSLINSDGTNLEVVEEFFHVEHDLLTRVEWSSDGTKLLYAFGAYGYFRIADMVSGKVSEIAPGSFPSMSPDGSQVVCTRQDLEGEFNTALIDVSGNLKWSIPGEAAAYLDWSADGSMIVYSKTVTAVVGWPDPEGVVVVRDAATGEVLHSIPTFGFFQFWVK
ncbi:MAG: TolB family protein [Candidatus Kapaibacterium sp.]